MKALALILLSFGLVLSSSSTMARCYHDGYGNRYCSGGGYREHHRHCYKKRYCRWYNGYKRCRKVRVCRY